MLICDSLEALAGRDGETVLTAAPAVALSGRPGVEVIDARLSAETTEAILAALEGAARRIFAELEAKGLEAEARLAAMVAERTTAEVFEAAMLTERELASPVTVIRIETGNAAFDGRINGPWKGLLAANRNLTEETVAIGATEERHGFGSEPPELGLRVALAPLSRMLLSAAERAGRTIPMRLWRRRIGVVSRNELIDDAVAGLALRGYLPVTVARPRNIEPQANAAAEAEVTAAFAHYAEALGPFIHPDVLAALAARKLARLVASCRDYWALREALAKRPLPEVDAILVNAPHQPFHLALAEVCEARGVPLIGAQHGVALEIAECATTRNSLSESTVCRHVLNFNEGAARFARANPFAIGKTSAVACGLSSTHAAERRFSRLRAGDRALYVSTMLYRGYVQNRSFFASDTDLARLEISILEDALENLPYPVDFKPYPALRYPDADPVLARVRESRSVGMVGTHTDLRYIIGRYRLVVSGAATSTIGWCVAADVPFVYLDHYGIGRLSAEARALFEAGSFYFDLEAPGAMAALRAFLDRPLAEIDAEWRDKAAGVEQLKRFLGADHASAGPAAARAVIDAIGSVRAARAARAHQPQNGTSR